MSSKHRAFREEDERARAVERLRVAEDESGRARGTRESAGDTGAEVEANVSVRAAEDEVAARKRWLRAVDDHDY